MISRFLSTFKRLSSNTKSLLFALNHNYKPKVFTNTSLIIPRYTFTQFGFCTTKESIKNDNSGLETKDNLLKKVLVDYDKEGYLTSKSVINILETNFYYGLDIYKAKFKERNVKYDKLIDDPVQFINYSKEFSEEMESLFHQISFEVVQKLDISPAIWSRTLTNPSIAKNEEITEYLSNWHDYVQQLLYSTRNISQEKKQEIIDAYSRMMKILKKDKEKYKEILEDEEDIYWYFELSVQYKVSKKYNIEMYEVYDIVSQYFSNELDNIPDVLTLKDKLINEIESIQISNTNKFISSQSLKDILNLMIKLSLSDYKEVYERFCNEIKSDFENDEIFISKIKHFFKTKQNIFEGILYRLLPILNININLWNESLKHHLQTDSNLFEYYHRWQMNVLKTLYPLEVLDSRIREEALNYYYDQMLKYSERMDKWAEIVGKKDEVPIIINERVVMEMYHKFGFNLNTIYTLLEEAANEMLKQANKS